MTYNVLSGTLILYTTTATSWHNACVRVYICVTVNTTHKCGVVVHLSVFWALNFECVELEHAFLAGRYVFGIYLSVSYVKVIGSRSRLQGHKILSVHRVCE